LVWPDHGEGVDFTPAIYLPLFQKYSTQNSIKTNHRHTPRHCLRCPVTQMSIPQITGLSVVLVWLFAIVRDISPIFVLWMIKKKVFMPQYPSRAFCHFSITKQHLPNCIGGIVWSSKIVHFPDKNKAVVKSPPPWEVGLKYIHSGVVWMCMFYFN